jgi:RNA polymerase sigma factor (TIGR02999 family)
MAESPETGTSPAALLDAALEDLAGDRTGAFDRAFSLAYDEVKALARARVGAWASGATLSPTALVHEAYLKVDRSVPDGGWQDRTHFLAFLGKAMRHILVDHARARQAQKRGGGRRDVTLVTFADRSESPDPVDVLALERALEFLAERDPRLERVVECRFFAGMTTEETAEILGTSPRTVERDWTRAKLYLNELLRNDFGGGDRATQ